MNLDTQPCTFVTNLPHGQQWGHDLQIMDVWTERGSRWDGTEQITRARFQVVDGSLWLLRKHCDGHWVTWRKPTLGDIRVARAAWERDGLEQPPKIVGEGR